MRFCFNSLIVILFSAIAMVAHAEDKPSLQKPGRAVVSVPASSKGAAPQGNPVSISAQRMEGKKDSQLEASGEVELHHENKAIFADRVIYLQESRDMVADGAVRMEQDGNVISGPHLSLNLDTHIGSMTQPDFHLGINNARGRADVLNIEGTQNYNLHNVSYTTCPAGDDDWLLKMSMLEIDRDRQVGVAHNAHVEFMGVPILYSPWMDFPLGGRRKSGFLGPTFGNTVQSGSEMALPFFWNIAPNLDATIEPRVMSRRGTMLNNEFRYLEPDFTGEAHLDILPADRVAKRTRTHSSIKHAHNLGNGFGASANFNYVSDDAYFRDLSNSVSNTSQANLMREGALLYGADWWNAAVRVQRYQTLQDPVVPVTVPYRRMPQITLGAQHVLGKANMTLAGEYVDFRHPSSLNGQRLVLYPSISYSLITSPAFYLTPKLGVHSTDYIMGANNVGEQSDAVRSVPIFSLDSGVAFEREWGQSGQVYVQTLEPRVYYVYIPYHDQSALPNFDSAQADFSFAQMFTENRFFGNDRIGDADYVTLALTSRLLKQDTGAEHLRIVVGERFSLKTPRVNLATPSDTTNKSDILLAASGQLTSAWFMDSEFQFNPNQSHTEKFNIAARYKPESGKLLNLGYRFTRNSIRQVDLSAQWPLFGRWHAMARRNYSVQDSRLLEALVGLEYNQSCWSVRMVAQRFATATNEFSTGFFVQLELNDLMRMGVGDTLNVLQQSVPGYTRLRSPNTEPAQLLP